MNMFRNLLTVALLALGIGIGVSDPTGWRWADPGGPYVVIALNFLSETRPFSPMVIIVVAVALFMTRKQF
jgi:hypothetical protein